MAASYLDSGWEFCKNIFFKPYIWKLEGTLAKQKGKYDEWKVIGNLAKNISSIIIPSRDKHQIRLELKSNR